MRKRTLLITWRSALISAVVLGSLPVRASNKSINAAERENENILVLKTAVQNDSGFRIDIDLQKVFTPNGDGINDYFLIGYENPSDAIVNGKIYDLSGRYISNMQKNILAEFLIWNGRDSDGNPQSSGVYLYQIEVSGQEFRVVNGTIVLAR